MSCEIREGKYYAPNGQPSKLYEDLKNRVGEAQAKDLFVLTHTPKFIKSIQNPIIYNYKQRLPQIPQGVTFKEVNVGKIRTFQLFEGGTQKGRIQLTAYKDGFKVKSSLLNEGEEGKGLGKVMYSYTARKLIQEGYSLYSDQIRTEAATRVWESLAKSGITENNNTKIPARPSNTFDLNGEILAENVLKYATMLNSSVEVLSFAEQQEARMFLAQFPQVSNSNELYGKLENAFYKDGLFSPSKESLRELYTNYEADKILSDINILGKVKETVEKLKRTEAIENTAIIEATYKSDEIDSFGKLKVENPYIITQDIIEEFGGVENADLSEIKDKKINQEFLDKFKRVSVVKEDGQPVIEEVIYAEAVKVVDNPNVLKAINTVENAHSSVDTGRLEQKITAWLLNYGINIEGFTKDLLPSLRNFITSPNVTNTQIFSDKYREVFNLPVKGREKVLKLENKDRDLVYLETNKTEQQLFDEKSLILTETPNVYQVVEKVDFQEMRAAFDLKEDVTELEAYKDYFNYTETPNKEGKTIINTELNYSLDYLTNEFIADFNIAKLKNPKDNFYSKFEITEKGIELKYQDPISLLDIQAGIADGIKYGQEIAEYSLISKQMPNLISLEGTQLNTKYDNRIQAINNFGKVAKSIGNLTKINSNVVVVKNASEEFLNIENELFELTDKEGNLNVYQRIAQNENLNYNELNPTITLLNNIQLNLTTQEQREYASIKKLWNSESLGDKFGCI